MAQKLVKNFLAIQAVCVKLQQDYVPKFSKVLPAPKVARYYQLETKIDAVVNYDVSAEIPLVQ